MFRPVMKPYQRAFLFSQLLCYYNFIMSLTKKWVVVLIGPPGSGKGTQAEMLAEKFGLFHLETSKLGEEKINDLELVKKDPEVAEAKRLYDKGELFPPPWTVKITVEKIRELAGKGVGIVFSGSPRTLHEAENEMPILEKVYGKENIKPIHLNLTKEESVKRNSSRRICKANRHSIPDFPMFKGITTCLKDGSELIKRSLDTPETIGVRYEVYLRQTQPILSFIQEKGYKVIEIEGEQEIEKVFEDIIEEISKS